MTRGDSSKRTTVITQLRGGLGNQLFQYCAGLNIAQRVDGQPVFEPDPLGRGEMCSAVGLPIRVSPPTVGERIGEHYGRRADMLRVRNVGHKVMDQMRLIEFVEQWATPYEPLDTSVQLRGRRTVRLKGRFQDPSWLGRTLDSVVSEVLEFLDQQPPLTANGNFMAVSFRRGDYTSLGWSLPLSYYADALDEIDCGLACVVLCDDRDFAMLAANWLTANGYRAVSASAVGGGTLLGDLTVLTRARAVVMANSTFCWWGTVLGDALSPGRRVAFPDPWAHWLPHEDGGRLQRDSWIPIAWQPRGSEYELTNTGYASGQAWIGS